MKFFNWIRNSFYNDRDNWVLWLPVIFGLGAIFYFSFPHNPYFFPLFLLLSSVILAIIFKERTSLLLIISLMFFLFGFLWTKFYTEKIAYTPKVEFKFYATAVGEIDNISSFYNPILKRNAYQVTLKDVNLYKAESLPGDVLVKKEKPKKAKKYHKKKPRKNKKRAKKKEKSEEQNQSKEENGQGEKPAKKPKKQKSKKENKTVINHYLNLPSYQEIDREFLAIDYKYQDQFWLNNKYKTPPKKIIFSVNTNLNGAKIGDIIQTRVTLEPFKKPYLPGGYDPGFENYFKGIGGSGYAASDLKILKPGIENNFLQEIRILRQKIAKKLLDQMDEKSGGIAVALLVGSQNFVSADIMNDVRRSGLAHLLSISGLHFTLAAGIFFFSIRFLLSLNQYLVLNYDIKKIASLIAIFTGFFYLLLADMPVPAVRSFIVIALIFLAILLDLKPDAFRSTAFAALAILILGPNAIYSVSFQLSFAAILSLIVLADFTKKYHLNSSERSLYARFFFYFLGIMASSIAATIATTPFSIYYFNNFISYGSLANLAAIPIASFVTMPCGFLALLLMPFGIEKLALIPMQVSIHWIIDIANYAASLPYSYFPVKAISTSSFALIIFGGLWFCLWKKSWRLLGFVPIILGIYFAHKTPRPSFLIDEQRKMFAFYYNEKLVFLRPTKSKQARIWAGKMGVSEITDIGNLSEEEKEDLKLDCNKTLCAFRLKEESVLVLSGRNKISDICGKDYDLVINLERKYQAPECVDEARRYKIGM
ncbi:MAG: ComEC family competence protein [Rickettsiaceae bacterium]|jgi:ComEC/Rec2-related protein|nr:ComEC family competence protein [Rickettsiaceae bacterium]